MRALLIPLLAAVAPLVSAQNLIQNGDFEKGSSVPWVTGLPGFNSGFATLAAAHTGSFSLYLPANAVPNGSGGAIVVPGAEEQAFTLTDEILKVSFWGYNGLDIDGPAFGIMLYGPDGFGPDVFMDAKPGWNLYTYEVPADNTLRFDHLRLTAWTNNPAAVFGSYIDDVTVEAVPEPATMAACVAGLGCLGLRNRIRRGK